MGQIATPFVLSETDRTTLTNLASKGKDGVVGAIEFSTLARKCLDRRIGSRTAERSERAVKVHWSFTVATAEKKLKRWHEQVNPVNKPADSTT